MSKLRITFLVIVTLGAILLLEFIAAQFDIVVFLIIHVLLLVASIVFLPRIAARVRRLQRARLKRAEDVLAEDPRPPVVYLRAFSEDSTGRDPGPHSRVGPMTTYGIVVPQEPVSFEAELSRKLKAVGPFVGLGKPSRGPPVGGAARLETPYDDWQRTVIGLLKRCRLVLFRAGDTESLRWEMGQVVRLVPPERIIFYLQIGSETDAAVQQARYNRFRRTVEMFLPVRLPETRGRNSFLHFTGDWEPRLSRTLARVLAEKELPEKGSRRPPPASAH